jgi:hypothetical protein
MSLGFVAAAGNLTQLFPPWMPTGVNSTTAVNGDLLRKPTGGKLGSIQIATDNTNGGTIEIWDLNGEMAGVNVSSATTITNAQLTALQALGKAKLLYSQNFTSTAGAATPAAVNRIFSMGLAARFVGSAGACSLNLVVQGGAYLTQKVG